MAHSVATVASPRFSLQQLPRSNNFTKHLPPDPQYPSPDLSHSADRSALGPRLVKGALYTYVRPDPPQHPKLLAVSTAALESLAIDPDSIQSQDFLDTVSGRKLLGTSDDRSPPSIYPWAQCYGGYQFGQWAGQLGDGRAISLFETTNPATHIRYEVQLKGAGKTPYSRFADGKAVLRSSIREFVVSEYLHALGIPTTRALSLTLCPESQVRRERIEPGAIVARFAQSWIRIGTFDLPRSRGDRVTVRKLADYVIDHVLSSPAVSLSVHDEEPRHDENRYAQMYRDIVRRNAKTIAAWQAYAFTNGVLNTDNTSILGLSMDFGPFAFLDRFDPAYTPNHDDHMLRYCYQNQPDVIWWNLLRLGEALAELVGAGPQCDAADFVDHGLTDANTQQVIERAERVITNAGKEYKSVFNAEYNRLMTIRIGLKTCRDSDPEELHAPLLEIMAALELDFNHTFRKLGDLSPKNLGSSKEREKAAGIFFPSEALHQSADVQQAARKRLADWLELWKDRAAQEWGLEDDARKIQMNRVNPKFVPRSWILDELIDRVEKRGERQILQDIMEMTLDPFKDHWGWDEAEEERFCGEVPPGSRAMQCSCSS